MSFFNKAIASTGFGAIKADMHLDAQKVFKGEQVAGYIGIWGGKSEQKISKVSLILMSYIDFDEDNYESSKSIELLKLVIAHDIQILPNIENKIPFSFVMPYDTPITFSNNMIWLEAGLDNKATADASDKSYIQVTPHPYMQSILDILQKDLKFILTGHENIHVPNNGSHLPIVQVFVFNPTTILTENLDEIKMIFFVDDLRGLEIVMEFPKRAPGSSENSHKANSAGDKTVRILIPKKEFEKDNISLADFLLCNIKAQLNG